MYLGDKDTLRSQISKVTGIDPEVLRDSSRIQEFSISERMSWAARRKTTRIEDRAYSLLGIFGIDDMPMMYGQGETAFRRLQEKIIDGSDDHSIFAWQGLEHYGPGALARSPEAFALSGNIGPILDDSQTKVLKQIIEVSVKLKPCGQYTYIGLLNCAAFTTGERFGIYLRQLPGSKRYARIQHREEDFIWVSEPQANMFQPADRITIYQDISDLKTRFRALTTSRRPTLVYAYRIHCSRYAILPTPMVV
jgi:hypothetical protein